MQKNLIFSLSIFCLICFSCSKSKSPGPQINTTSSIKIELVSGSDQVDTIGRPLANPIVVKITQNGIPLNNYGVLYEGSGCNAERLDEFSTAADGTAQYNWWLASDVGAQTLTIVAINAQNQKVDSVIVTANGLAPGHGWHFSACTYPFGLIPSTFCKLSTGRLVTSLPGGKTYMRYSDDNGISWNSVKGLGKSHDISFVVSSPADELFAFGINEGMFYSNDAGKTWTSPGQELFDGGDILNAVVTPSGKLLAATNNRLYLSLDKGKTWTVSGNGFTPSFGIGDIAEDKSGNLYVISLENQSIYKSSDKGGTWINITALPKTENDFSLYIDNNNWFYKSRSDPGGGIFISKDGGLTYTPLIDAPNRFMQKMSVQSDGNFYYDVLGQGLYMAAGISNSVKNLDDNEFNVPTTYIVAKNNNIIYANTSSGYIKYYQK